MKFRDDAVLYNETLRELGVEDPMSGKTAVDKEHSANSEKYDAQMRALKETVAKGWDHHTAPVTARPKRKARTAAR